MESNPIPASGTSLSVLLATLGPLLLSPYGPANGSETDPEVRASVVWDPLERVPSIPGGILLMTGASVVAGIASTAIQQAATFGYAAVVIKSRDLAKGLIDVSRAGDVQVLRAPDDASWNSLHALISAAVSNPGHVQSASVAGITPGDLFSLANAIAATAGTAVTIENVNREVVAYSNIAGQETDDDRRDAILGRVVPDLPWYLARYRAVAMATGPVFFGPENGALDRVAMPIRVGSRLIGSLWAFDDAGRRSEEIARVLADAAPIASLHLMHAASAYGLQRHRRGELLTAALGGGQMDPDVALTLARQMPVVLIGFAHFDDEHGTEVDIGRAADIIALNAEAVRRTASCTVLQGRVFVLLPGADQLSGQRIQQFMAASQRAVSSAAGADLRCAYSGELHNAADLARAHEDIETAFRFQSMEAMSTSICTEDERHRILVQELSEGTVAAPDRLLPSVRRILDYDSQNSTEYASTLLAFLDAFGDTRRAAEITMVHENSQRYRMRQLTKRFGVDLDDPSLRLITWLQLYLHKRQRG